MHNLKGVQKLIVIDIIKLLPLLYTYFDGNMALVVLSRKGI